MGYWFWNRNEVSELVGQTITAVDEGDAEIKFILSDGRTAVFWHEQDCCESVDIEDINGDWKDLLNTPLLVAEERTESGDSGYDSETWTFYTFRTIKGSVDVRWYGSSNGYYSERVDFRIDGKELE